MKRLYPVLTAAVTSALCACGGDNSSGVTSSGSAITNIPSSVQLTSGNYSLSIFAQAQGSLRPDDIVQLGSSVFVVYQDNNVQPDGTLAPGVKSAQSEVIEFDLNGNILETFDVPGHPDGLVAYDATSVWVSSNEDANPVISVIDTTSNTLKSYTSDVATLPHGGGLDDMKLVNGVVYASASNPTLTAAPSPNLSPYSTDSSGATGAYGVNTGPAVYAISLNGEGTFHATPALMSSTPATLLPGNTPVTLNMTDADSSAIDPSGDLVIDSQQDSELVFVKNVGTGSQSVDVLPLTLYGNPWPVDDTRWSPASGSSFMLLSDNSQLVVYRVDALGGFPAKQAYSAGQGTLLETNATTGVMLPIYVGMKSPHGLIFVTP